MRASLCVSETVLCETVDRRPGCRLRRPALFRPQALRPGFPAGQDAGSLYGPGVPATNWRADSSVPRKLATSTTAGSSPSLRSVCTADAE